MVPILGDIREPTIEELQAGSTGAVDTLKAAILRVVRHRGWYIPEQDREDVCQETLLDLYRSVARPGLVLRSGLCALAREIACRRCVDWIRCRRVHQEIAEEPTDGAPGPEESVIETDTIAMGWRVIEGLRESCREVIRLHAAGLSSREIAEQQDRTEGAVRTQLSQCVKEARALFERIRLRDSDRARPIRRVH